VALVGGLSKSDNWSVLEVWSLCRSSTSEHRVKHGFGKHRVFIILWVKPSLTKIQFPEVPRSSNMIWYGLKMLTWHKLDVLLWLYINLDFWLFSCKNLVAFRWSDLNNSDFAWCVKGVHVPVIIISHRISGLLSWWRKSQYRTWLGLWGWRTHAVGSEEYSGISSVLRAKGNIRVARVSVWEMDLVECWHAFYNLFILLWVRILCLCMFQFQTVCFQYWDVSGVRTFFFIALCASLQFLVKANCFLVILIRMYCSPGFYIFLMWYCISLSKKMVILPSSM
jgi:hypothetical protein